MKRQGLNFQKSHVKTEIPCEKFKPVINHAKQTGELYLYVSSGRQAGVTASLPDATRRRRMMSLRPVTPRRGHVDTLTVG